MSSLLRLGCKTKKNANPFLIRIFLFLSYSFGIETVNTFIHSRSSLKTIPDSRQKWAKCIPVFRPKRRKNPTRWGGTCLYGLYKRVAPPGGGVLRCDFGGKEVMQRSCQKHRRLTSVVGNLTFSKHFV